MEGYLPLPRFDAAAGPKILVLRTSALLRRTSYAEPPTDPALSQYIIDGYHVSHDPDKPSTLEPTTGRELNILDVPASRGSGSSSASRATSHRRNLPSIDIPKGRPLSTSQIKSPKPEKPYQTKHLYEHPTADELASRFAQAHLDDDDDDDDDQEDYLSSSPPSSVGSSLSSRSDSNSPSSASSLSDLSSPATPFCTCQRYGITRKGERVKLDCGGSRCGYADSSDCSSESDEDCHPRSTRRQGIVVRR